MRQADLFVWLLLVTRALRSGPTAIGADPGAPPPSQRASHVVVEQAKGFLRERLDIDLSEAFTLLRRHAQQQGTHTSDVARQLMGQPAIRPTIGGGLQQMTTGS